MGHDLIMVSSRNYKKICEMMKREYAYGFVISMQNF